MTNKLTLVASLVMLITISGQALAETVEPSNQKAVYGATAFDHTVAPNVRGNNAYRYQGGPKYND